MRRFICHLALGLGLAGCQSQARTPERPAPVAVARATALNPERTLLDRPRSQAELPTTDAKLYLGNLEARIGAGKKVWQRTGSPSEALGFIGTLTSTGKLTGDLARIDEAAGIASRALAKAPSERALWLVRADAHAALHRFARAARDVERAHALRPGADSEAMLAELAWNRGDYAAAIRGIRKAAQTPSFAALTRLAQLELDLGNVSAAENAFARAETLLRDVSPLPVAWLNVQRGLLFLHTGRFRQAELFYREAVARLPGYPLAVEHLAEVEALLGKRESAVRRYREVIASTQNPEYMSALAGVLTELGDDATAQKWARRARARNAELLAAHPEAMYWHAAEFFLDADEPERGLWLLEKNLHLRPNADSYAALAKAELALGKIDAASASIGRALGAPVRRAEIFWTAARVRLAQGKRREAEQLAARARQLNPEIARLEAPLD